MKRLFILIAIVFCTTAVQAQKTFIKTLFFYEDSVTIYPCGGVLEVSLYYFVKDTCCLNAGKPGYYIAILCAEAYGEGFFKKGVKYLLTLNRDYNKIKRYMPPDNFKIFMKQKNFYVLKSIKKVEM